MNIVISSGHGKLIRGAEGYLDEVDEARKVVNKVAKYLANFGAVYVFHDDISTGQSENLNRIVDFHNSKKRDLDISVHFNAYKKTDDPMGTECLYVSQEQLSDDVSAAIAKAGGFKDRGPKYRDDLFFLNNTDEDAILIEVCFVDSSTDAELYHANFDKICQAITQSVTGQTPVDAIPPESVTTPPGDVMIPVLTITVDPPGSVKVIVK